MKFKVHLLFRIALFSSDSLNILYAVVDHTDYYNNGNESSGNPNSNIEVEGDTFRWSLWEWNRTTR